VTDIAEIIFAIDR